LFALFYFETLFSGGECWKKLESFVDIDSQWISMAFAEVVAAESI
jgi:hypothetical protein